MKEEKTTMPDTAERTEAPQRIPVETPKSYFDVYYLKMILAKIPDGTALEATTTVKDIIMSISAGQQIK